MKQTHNKNVDTNQISGTFDKILAKVDNLKFLMNDYS